MICSFAPLISSTSKILILGTMPGVQSLQKQEYYGHPQNQFWKIMFTLFASLPVPRDFSDRKQMLIDNDIAVWDVLESCQREGSLDSAIKNGVPNQIPKLIAQNSGIKVIACNGKESHRMFVKNFGHIIDLPLLVMPSTSPAYTLSFEKKLERWREILEFVGK